MKEVKDIFVSVVALVLPGQHGIEDSLKTIESVLASHYAHFEILLVDTEECIGVDQEMDSILKKISKIRYLRLFHTVSLRVLTAAGMENAIGDIIVSGNIAYLSPENIVRAVDCCCSGYDVVNGVTAGRRSLPYLVGSKVFRFLFGKMISYNLPENDTFFRCISRRALNASLNTPHFYKFVFLRLNNCGGKQCNLKIDIPKPLFRKYSCKNTISTAISLLIFNTTTPLRVMNGIALFSSFLCILFALYSLMVNYFKETVVEGWTTLMLVLSSMFFMMFLILAFIGEYLVRIIADRADLSPYQVMFERHSSVMLHFDTLNIRENSTSSNINLTQTGRDR